MRLAQVPGLRVAARTSAFEFKERNVDVRRIGQSLGVRHVLEGTEVSFSMEYPCHSPTEQRWFVMNVSRIMDGSFGAVVSHVNVTPWRRAAGVDD